jgi:hypothetical protein
MTPILLLAVVLAVAPATGGSAEAGDFVHFKDGMRTICTGRAWEEQDHVLCEYEGGLLSYPKADVERIVKATPAPPTPGPPASTTTATTSDTSPAAEANPRILPPEPSVVQPILSGVAFYDPRRPQKYWSGPGRGHDSYPEAIAALAQEFDRPPGWIEERMGDTNDLGAIRAALARLEESPPSESRPKPAAEGAEFYSPRRANPYRTGPDTHHLTYADALDALALEFGRTPDWIEAHMGESNDLERIRLSLKAARDAE